MQTQQKEDTANEKELFNNRYVRDKEREYYQYFGFLYIYRTD